MQSLNWVSIIAVTLASWAGWALWFGPLFGKLWMKIHWSDEKKAKAAVEDAMKGMWKLLVAEIVSCFVLVTALAYAISMNPAVPGYQMAFWIWLGFVLPTYVTATLWGNDEKKWMCAKIALSAGYRLVMLVLAGYALAVR